jgi:3-hydroxypropanoate dehydrogenase
VLAPEACLDLAFRAARSHNRWLPKPVSDDELRGLYELMKWGPTSANSNPARIFFLRTLQAKERLKPALDPGNIEKAMTAPVVAIVGHDGQFYERMPRLFPHRPEAREWFAGESKRAFAETTAFRNGTLQGAYLLVAARLLGLACGPMSGFDNARLDAEFFRGTSLRSNFLCALGHGDRAQLFPRGPRLPFDEACQLL